MQVTEAIANRQIGAPQIPDGQSRGLEVAGVSLEDSLKLSLETVAPFLGDLALTDNDRIVARPKLLASEIEFMENSYYTRIGAACSGRNC
jgi:hypothetical protein